MCKLSSLPRIRAAFSNPSASRFNTYDRDNLRYKVNQTCYCIYCHNTHISHEISFTYKNKREVACICHNPDCITMALFTAGKA